MKTPSSKVRFVALVTAVCLLGDSMLYVVMPIYPEQFGLMSLWEVGILLSVNRFVRIPIHPVVHQFYEHYSTRQGLFVGLLLTLLSTFLYGALDSFIWLIFARVGWGIAWSFLRQGGQLSIVEATQESNVDQSGSLTGLYNGLSRTGSLVGMLAGGIGAGLWGADVLCYIFAGAALVIVPFLARSARNDRSAWLDKPVISETLAIHTNGKSKITVLLIAGFLVSFIYQGLLKSTLGFWVAEQVVLTTVFLGGLGAAVWTGILQAVRWGLEPIAAPGIGRLSDRPGMRIIILLFALGLSSVSFILLPVTLPPVIWLLTVVLLLFTAVAVSTLLDADLVEYAAVSNKRSLMAWYLVISDLGAAFGPVVGFLLIETTGHYFVSWGSAAILLIIAALIGWGHWNAFIQRRRRTAELAQ